MVVPRASLLSKEEKKSFSQGFDLTKEKISLALELDELSKQIKSLLGGLLGSVLRTHLQFSFAFQTEMCFVWSSSELAARKM